jgi:hypothetical protein
MDPVPDKESEEHGDTVLLSEIISDSIYREVLATLIQQHNRNVLLLLL